VRLLIVIARCTISLFTLIVIIPWFALSWSLIGLLAIVVAIFSALFVLVAFWSVFLLSLVVRVVG